MIDRKKRDLLIRNFRSLLAGSITNLEYDDLDLNNSFDSEDPAPWCVFSKTWYLYDDFTAHPVKLTKEGREYFARCILFLYTDCEYEWPFPTGEHDIKRTMTVLTGGIFPWWQEPSYKKLGDHEVWPFFKRKDYENAKSKNPFGLN